MTAEIVDGPWSGPPVVQDPPRLTPDRWWERLDNGSLLVLCRGARHRGERYQIAPVAEWHPLEGEGTVANVVPDRTPNRDRISIALDIRGLYGPEVDEALGVADALDTVVDAWESGHLVPTESEIRRLSMLTGMLPAWFYSGTLPLIDRVFLCPR